MPPLLAVPLVGWTLAAAPAVAQGSGTAAGVPATAERATRRTAVYGEADRERSLEERLAASRAAFGAGLVASARQYVGTPYRWGGVTPRAFDCSGFVRWVFAERGVAMPRTAREQAGVGDAPYPGDLRPGDLLFFWGGQGAQHVAIYAGGDSIIHASVSGRRVRLDRLEGRGADRNWFGRRLIAVRRVEPAAPSAAQDVPPRSATIFAGGYR